MALTGSTQNKRPGAGVYPGAGVAKGGQQGRMNTVHNGGVATKSGGRTPGASQPRGQAVTGTFGTPVRSPGVGTVPAGTPAPVGAKADPYRRIMRNGQSVLVRWSQLTPAERRALGPTTAGGGGAAPAPGAGAPAGTAPAPVSATPLSSYTPQLHDSNYFMDLAGAQSEFDAALNPINSELARLRYNGVGGRTLYDTMFDDANRRFDLSVRDTRDQMHKLGLGRSGRFDRAATDLGSGWLQQQRELDETVGPTAINRLETQAAQQRDAFAQRQSALEMAAAAREQERRAAFNQGLYGMTIMPTEE